MKFASAAAESLPCSTADRKYRKQYDLQQARHPHPHTTHHAGRYGHQRKA